MDKRLFLIACLTLILGFPLYSQDVIDPSPSYNVGFSVFAGVDLEPENLYLVKSIPLLIRDRVTICKSHIFSENGIDGYRRYLIRKKMDEIELKVEELYQQRDAHLFDPSRSAEQLEKLDESIETFKEEIEKFSELDPSSIEVENPKPIDYLQPSDLEELYPLHVVPPELFLETHGLDMLIGGTIEEVEGFFYIEVFAFSKALDDYLYTREDALSGDSLGNKINQISDELTTVLLGRDWGNILIEADPPSTDIYLDDVYIGTGTASGKLLDTGQHQLKLEAEGYQMYSRKISLVPFIENRFSLSLEKKTLPSIGITTYPQGADVYMASRWIGRTPLFIPKSDLSTSLTLKKEDFRDINLYNLGLETSDLRTYFPTNRIDLGTFIDEKRDDVYTALGFFAISVPFPIILYNLSNEYAGTELTARLYRIASVCYYSYVGTLVISASLFINTVVHLIQYLAAVESR